MSQHELARGSALLSPLGRTLGLHLFVTLSGPCLSLRPTGVLHGAPPEPEPTITACRSTTACSPLLPPATRTFLAFRAGARWCTAPALARPAASGDTGRLRLAILAPRFCASAPRSAGHSGIMPFHRTTPIEWRLVMPPCILTPVPAIPPPLTRAVCGSRRRRDSPLRRSSAPLLEPRSHHFPGSSTARSAAGLAGCGRGRPAASDAGRSGASWSAETCAQGRGSEGLAPFCRCRMPGACQQGPRQGGPWRHCRSRGGRGRRSRLGRWSRLRPPAGRLVPAHTHRSACSAGPSARSTARPPWPRRPRHRHPPHARRLRARHRASVDPAKRRAASNPRPASTRSDWSSSRSSQLGPLAHVAAPRPGLPRPGSPASLCRSLSAPSSAAGSASRRSGRCVARPPGFVQRHSWHRRRSTRT